MRYKYSANKLQQHLVLFRVEQGTRWLKSYIVFFRYITVMSKNVDFAKILPLTSYNWVKYCPGVKSTLPIMRTYSSKAIRSFLPLSGRKMGFDAWFRNPRGIVSPPPARPRHVKGRARLRVLFRLFQHWHWTLSGLGGTLFGLWKPPGISWALRPVMSPLRPESGHSALISTPRSLDGQLLVWKCAWHCYFCLFFFC